MCLAIPLKIISLSGTDAVGEVDGVERDISVMMTPGVKVGDYVIVHAGFAIQTLDRKEAEENLEMLREMTGMVEETKKGVRERKR